MAVPCYPDFIPLTLDLRAELHPLLARVSDGISEFTFSNLFLFRNRYQYRVSLLKDQLSAGHTGLIVSGITPGDNTPFFMTPGSAFPGIDTVMRLFESHGYWKNIPLSLLELPCNGIPYRQKLEEQGISFTEDRDNDDYLYLRSDLAGLSGKKFHKKKNLVNAFSYAWPDHEQFPLSPSLIPDAQEILNQWKEDKGDDADYVPSKESLEFFSELEMRGAIYYIGGKPAAYCLGESVSGGSIFCIHFEKGLDRYKGIYQYMNQTFAASLEQEFTFINREQDLGNAGLRQAKLTYRPVSFIKKYRGVMISN